MRTLESAFYFTVSALFSYALTNPLEYANIAYMKKYTKKYFQEMGKKGGDKTKEIYGKIHFSKINPKKKAKVLLQEQAIKEAFPHNNLLDS